MHSINTASCSQRRHTTADAVLVSICSSALAFDNFDTAEHKMNAKFSAHASKHFVVIYVWSRDARELRYKHTIDGQNCVRRLVKAKRQRDTSSAMPQHWCSHWAFAVFPFVRCNGDGDGVYKVAFLCFLNLFFFIWIHDRRMSFEIDTPYLL